MANNPVSYELLTSKGYLNNTCGFTVNPCGLYNTFVNKTGATSVLGTIVIASTIMDNAVGIAPANADVPIGVIAESGVPDGQPVKVVFTGVALVLAKDGLSSTRGYWCGVSDTAGRAYFNPEPPAFPAHNREVGHCLESASSGTDVLVRVMLHYN